ncbi:MAG: hypothetical protein U5L11_15125 [Arhodomonas sp.]|nr:hypothetical protein [Arhodomonas sp.]
MSGVPPSPTAGQPAAFSAAISVSCSPASPRVSAPTGRTRAPPAARARRSISSATGGVSVTGSVSGGQTSVVMPPRTAARASLAMVAWVFAVRPPQTRADVDESGADDLSGGVDDLDPGASSAGVSPR